LLLAVELAATAVVLKEAAAVALVGIWHLLCLFQLRQRFP
jgi:hypothetical protein